MLKTINQFSTWMEFQKYKKETTSDETHTVVAVVLLATYLLTWQVYLNQYTFNEAILPVLGISTKITFLQTLAISWLLRVLLFADFSDLKFRKEKFNCLYVAASSCLRCLLISLLQLIVTFLVAYFLV